MAMTDRTGETGQSSAEIGSDESPSTRLLERVHEGMAVVDAAGERLGRVEDVVMGDPEAATTQGNEAVRRGGIVGAVADAVRDVPGEPDVQEPRRSQLLRLGYLKVDGPGLLAPDRYVRADQIRGVSADTVTLAVPRDAVSREQ
jgi:hypothetical protein